MQPAEAAAGPVEFLAAELHRLGPVRIAVPAAVYTAHAFHGVPLPALRALTRRWTREHRDLLPNVVFSVAERLWFSGSREAMIVASMLLERRPDARDHLDLATLRRWADEFDGWELVDNLGTAAVGPWVLDDPGTRFSALEALAADTNPWARRLALVGMLDLAADPGAGSWWPRVRAVCARLATDRQASIPKAISWVLRTWAKHLPGEVARFVGDDQAPVPAIARRETRHFLAFGRKRPASTRPAGS